MGILHEDVVIITPNQKQDEATVITINCPDKTGLGCDLCRIILFFGLSIVRGDVSTDGKWCFIVFWVVGKPSMQWSLLEKRLIEACPSCSSANTLIYYTAELQPPKPPDVFLLKFCGHDRQGLLHDVTHVLCELELIIQRVKVSTTPDGMVMDLFFITDARELLHTEARKTDTYHHLKAVVGDSMVSCDIEKVCPDITACSQGPPFLIPPAITEDTFNLEMLDQGQNGSGQSNRVSVMIDNSLSPVHTLVQIVCRDHKGLLYDIMRTLKDYNIQISYGRFTTKGNTDCEIDLFIVQADGKKIVDPSKQNALCSRIRMELFRPLRVALVNRGPDTELLVANPVELCGKGRPLVFYDITLALKMLNTDIFSAEISRHMIGGREWEVYRVLLDEGDGSSVPRSKIEEAVWRNLMGWE
ncbi:putative [Protein-PII] uridylyltransferase [Helianthus annuus]|uniref:ACT domain-containing protein ACR n=1 Tax=Helianthus annuus TaxID=4232 RepID=A0A251SR56_HELAN|nr:ACT domain-containing protein ACR10 [Helianthus annuus]KAF5773196.1 putative [Protein-PII] uridylyltransferase [Helianthus annuus]KAJ0476710.1 putative [Protein-PII] uridylyltransferase [Helianthus annuus]KAJ0481017.1 putative [Protein-PII] uridylyltransferase [Helianthus annuus]KAJ0497535.1 putative [Protein-PII] uridylyltransferase [Helianthus annuus]KAJ0663550.1 putative [Protein-PII] uridylyltransferase [Helianthus annuus]